MTKRLKISIIFAFLFLLMISSVQGAVIFADDFENRIKNLRKMLPSDWEHVFLSGVPHLEKQSFSDLQVLKTFLSVKKSVYTDCTYAYMVKNTAYDKLIAKYTSLETTTDDLLNNLIFTDETLTSYTYFPFCVCANTNIGSANRGGEMMAKDHPSVQYFKNKI